MTTQRRSLRIAYRNFFIVLSGMVALALLFVLPPVRLLRGWMNAADALVGPMVTLFLIPSLVGFVSLLYIGRLRLLRERWVFRRMAWGAAYGALGGVIFWGLERAADQPARQPSVLVWVALYMVIVAMMAVVIAPHNAAPAPASPTIDELYGALADMPLPEIDDGPLPESRNEA